MSCRYSFSVFTMRNFRLYQTRMTTTLRPEMNMYRLACIIEGPMMTPTQPARLLVAAALAALPIAAADHFPETAKDSEPILDEQYHQMDRYFDQQIAKAAQIRAQY